MYSFHRIRAAFLLSLSPCCCELSNIIFHSDCECCTLEPSRWNHHTSSHPPTHTLQTNIHDSCFKLNIKMIIYRSCLYMFINHRNTLWETEDLLDACRNRVLKIYDDIFLFVYLRDGRLSLLLHEYINKLFSLFCGVRIFFLFSDKCRGSVIRAWGAADFWAPSKRPSSSSVRWLCRKEEMCVCGGCYFKQTVTFRYINLEWSDR